MGLYRTRNMNRLKHNSHQVWTLASKDLPVIATVHCNKGPSLFEEVEGSVFIGPSVLQPTDHPLVGPKPGQSLRPGQVSLSVFILTGKPGRGKHAPIFMADDS
ncbi:hypothetical protein V6N13_012070 [Hibiscus sabdariffa]|uniref:Uncharacterized protein n=1 Tax=Hibiscus sabdariffa TaxID=183260 RepID=A0ABR2SEQ7_9ROSI